MCPVAVDIFDPVVRRGRDEDPAAATDVFELVQRIERRVKRRSTRMEQFLNGRDAAGEPQP